jgi:AcrR family transcriptional regulator
MPTYRPGQGQPAGRADARRNATRLVAVARDAFAEHGPQASLIEIARTAGVGSATLYRHFPSREALLAAVYQSQVETLSAEAEELLQSDASPISALDTWLRAFAAHLITYRGLKGLLTATYDDRAALFAECRRMLFGAATALLTRAQDTGAIRRTVDARQMLKLIKAVAIANEETGGEADELAPLLDLVIDGLRYQGGDPG